MNTPWFSPGAVKFLKENLAGKLSCFEWGSGDSTLWFAQRCWLTVSVEHNWDWFLRVHKAVQGLPAVVFHRELVHDYWDMIRFFRPDIVVIDGRHRKACAEQVAKMSPLPSLVIWDDAQRDYYQCSMGLFGSGWTRKDFVGGQPGDLETNKTTRLFIRQDGLFKGWL